MSFDFEDGRHFKNTFPPYSPTCPEIVEGKISPVVASKIENAVKMLVNQLGANLPHVDHRDESMYTGLSGLAYLFWFLSGRETNPQRRKEFTDTAHGLISRALPSCSGHQVTFLCGDAGPLVTSLLLGAGNAQEIVDRLLNLEPRAMRDRTPDEILYGRAGYLNSLLICLRLGLKTSAVEATMKRVVAKMLHSGQTVSASLKGQGPPLMYAWHDSFYFGAAHGLVGILYMLMRVPHTVIDEAALHTLVRPTIEWLIQHRFPSGNFPSSWGRERDKLVHWCHGAPGWIYMFAAAYEVFKDKRYLQLAEECAEVIWARGLLSKGYGICHGVAGNGYAHLLMYRLTQNEKHLYRAVKFAEFCCDYGQHGCNVADRPFSLYEGMAGTICFMMDCLDPMNARFPAFEL